MPLRLRGVYQLTRKIGGGAFSEVFGAIHVPTGEQVAVKIECIPPDSVAVIPYEYAVYQHLAGGIGIPRVHWSGTDADCRALVLDLLGPTLENLRHFCRGRLSLKTILMLADQMISRIEFIHSRGIICRDIKLDNFAMGIGRGCNIVHLFDFGLAKLYVDPDSGDHIPYKDGKTPLGTPRYASTHAHLGKEQGRRDDLESLGYCLLYLFHGHLPWKGIYAPSIPEKLEKIAKMKQHGVIAQMCAGLPPEFARYFKYCRELGFNADPDYTFLRSLFQGGMEREGWVYDSVFDWDQNVARETGDLLSAQYAI